VSWLIDRDGWYRITDDGFEYLGPDKPDDTERIMKVETIDHGNGVTERRAYQNTGGALNLGDQVIPDATVTWLR